MMNDDMELVRECATRQSEPAFETLVTRHAGLVYSAALRHVRDTDLAGEITQTVFIILARKAGSLNAKTILPGWLYRTTRYASSAALKMEQRRQRREQEAHMQAMLDESQNDAAWEQLSPLLDEAMSRLLDKDHDAIVLRYFQNQNLSQVGAALGVDEYAAQKRVSRALEKLRKFFAKRGVNSTTAIIAGAISANSVQVVPAALAKSVTAVAVTKGAAASGSTLTLIKGALKMMAWTKAKTVVVTAVVVLLSAGTAATASKWLWFGGDDKIRFEAEGTLTYEVALGSGGYTDTKHFIAARDGKIWKIRTITEKQERTGLGGSIGAPVDLYFET
jgi:RNA polymerase sigma factor (sigma-70 family)